jgi:hypothetical protein
MNTRTVDHVRSRHRAGGAVLGIVCVAPAWRSLRR